MHQLTLISSLLLATTTTAQSASLLFVPKKPEMTRHAQGAPALRLLTDITVGIVEPGGNCKYTAHKFVPGAAWHTLVGDEDGDGDVHSESLFDSIKAILVKPYEWNASRTKFVARSRPINARDIYITPKRKLGTNVSGPPGLRPCDCGSIQADGKVRYFLRGEQIISALGLVDQERRPLDPEDVRLDAITVDMSGTVYLSFEDTHLVQLNCQGLQTYTVDDGAVLMIPGGVFKYDLYGNIAAVKPNSGYVLFGESNIDQMVKRAKSERRSGACLTKCIDTDGLALDPRGGTLRVGWCNFVFDVPNLLFTTQAHTGAGVLSTRNWGEIAQVNGCKLARPCGAPGTTSGQQMGLRNSGNVGSLDGLATAFLRPFRFALSTNDVKTLGGKCEWHVGTSMNVQNVMLFAGNGVLPISPAWDILARLSQPTNSFPEAFPNAFVYGPILVTMVADGWGGRVGKFSFTVPETVAPNGLITQMFVHDGNWQASTPLTFVK